MQKQNYKKVALKSPLEVLSASQEAHSEKKSIIL